MKGYYKPLSAEKIGDRTWLNPLPETEEDVSRMVDWLISKKKRHGKAYMTRAMREVFKDANTIDGFVRLQAVFIHSPIKCKNGILKLKGLKVPKGKVPYRYVRLSVRLEVLSSGRCAYCGTTEYLTVDHIFPVSLGGSNERENLQCLCRRCNSSKGAKNA